MKTRTAIVRGRPWGNSTLSQSVVEYLPRGYEIVDAGEDEQGSFVEISGSDDAGWTLDGYVIPRLASGMLYATETTP